jgi:hypothetical protein
MSIDGKWIGVMVARGVARDIHCTDPDTRLAQLVRAVDLHSTGRKFDSYTGYWLQGIAFV